MGLKNWFRPTNATYHKVLLGIIEKLTFTLDQVTHTHTHTHTYIYIYIYVCVCVCVYMNSKKLAQKIEIGRREEK